MPIDVYDAEKHHIGLGPADDRQYGFSISGYTQTGQQYGGSQAYGGPDALISTPTLSRWTQEDFSGGDGQHVWGADPAMFSSCHGLLPNQLGKTVRTAPPLIQLSAPHASVGTRKPLGTFTYSGYLYTVFTNGVLKQDLHTGARTFSSVMTGGPTTDSISAFVFDQSYRTVIFTFNGTTNQAYKLPDFTSFAFTSTGLLGNPAQGGGNTALGIIANKLLLARGGAVYALTITENKDSWSFAAADWKAPTNNRLPGTWVTSYVYNNFLYILCSDPDTGTTVVYYDPGLDTIFTVCKIPYDFVGYSLVEYGGRIYVGGSGRDLNGDDAYAELYEVTGTSVRLVRTFSPESKSTAVSHPDAIRSMAVADGLLFWGNKGKCLGVYDATSDSFYDGPPLLDPSGVATFSAINSARNSVYVYLSHPTDNSKSGHYRVAVKGDTPGQWISKFVTSEFAPEIDRDKRWTQLRVMTRFGGVSAGYSVTGGAPGGDSFTAVPVRQVQNQGDNIITVFDLSAIPVSPNIRLQFQFVSTDSGAFIELCAFTLAFTLLDTGKRVWAFTVNATQYVEARDREAVIQNVHDIGNELWRYYLQRIPLNYTDVDGVVYKVTATSVGQHRPIIGPRVSMQGEQGYESLLSVQLIEV